MTNIADTQERRMACRTPRAPWRIPDGSRKPEALGGSILREGERDGPTGRVVVRLSDQQAPGLHPPLPLQSLRPLQSCLSVLHMPLPLQAFVPLQQAFAPADLAVTGSAGFAEADAFAVAVAVAFAVGIADATAVAVAVAVAAGADVGAADAMDVGVCVGSLVATVVVIASAVDVASAVAVGSVFVG